MSEELDIPVTSEEIEQVSDLLKISAQEWCDDIAASNRTEEELRALIDRGRHLFKALMMLQGEPIDGHRIGTPKRMTAGIMRL